MMVLSGVECREAGVKQREVGSGRVSLTSVSKEKSTATMAYPMLVEGWLRNVV
jgi:hypothetical protein